MNKKLNKLVTNYPVELNEKEIENLSATLAPVIAACGGGGGTGGKIYTGTGFVNVNNTTNQIGLTEDANDKLNKEYVEYNEYSTAIANRYTKTQTNALLDKKQDTLEFEYDENNKVSAINGSALAGQGGGTGDYTAGIDLKIENNIISVDTNGNPNNTASNTRNFVEGSWTVASGYNSHAEGMATTAYGYAVHAQGMWTKFSSSKWSDTQHPTPIDIYWAAGAGATVEGYCNATTSCPMSGTEGESDYGPIHGGILKVIGNGNVVHDQSVDPDAHIHTLQPSDALIIFKDGCISAAGNISANGIELGAGGATYQGRNGVNVDGSYVELTTTAYESVTSIPSISNDVDTLKGASGNWNKVSDKLDTTAFSTVSSNFLTEEDLDEYAKLEQLENVSGKLLTTAQYANDSATFLTAIPDTYALKTDIPTTVAQLTDSGNYYQKTETSSKTEITNALNTKVDKPTSIQTGKLVYDGDNNEWVTLPEGTTIIVQGQGSVTANYDSQNSTYTVSLLASAENALNEVDDKIDTTAVAQTYQTKADMDDYLTKSVASSTYQPKGSYLVADDITGKLDKSIYANASGNWENTYNIVNQYSAAGKWLTINDIDEYAKLQDLNTVSSTLTGIDEYLSGQIDNKVDKADLDDYVPYSATELVIGSGNEVDYHYNNVKNNFVQGTNNIVTNNNSETFVQGKANKLFTSQDSLLQGFGNSATNYYCLAQGALNNASTYSLTQGSNNTANSYSQAAGQNNSATTASIAFGNANTAKDYSIAQGEANSACDKTLAQGIANSGYYCSLVQGYHNYAYNYGLAQGYQNTAEYESFAQGYGNYAGKNGECHSLAQGYSNSAVYQSMAQGYMNTAYYDSFAQGFENSAFDNSMAQGLDNTAYKFGAAIGENNIAEEWSIALGQHNRAYNQSQAFGFRTIASGTVIDGHNYGMMAIGYCNNTSAGALFVAGNGYLDENSNIIRSDAFIIYPDGSVSAKGDISANGVKLGPGGGTSYQGRNGVNVDGGYIELTTTAYNAITSVSNKVDKPTSLNDKYLVLRTDNAGNVSGWCDFQDQSYSKSEAQRTFVATANIDTTTLSGDGKSVSTKLGVNTDVIATKDYVDSSFLPTSGGTELGSVQFSVASGKNILAVASAATLIGASRQTSAHYGVDNTALGTTWVGVGGDGMHQGFIKYTDGGNVGALDSNSTIQLNLKPSTNKFDSIQVQINGGSVGYLIPAVTSTTTAGLTNDGILHIILES